MNITALPDGVYCASTLDDEVEVAEATAAAQHMSVPIGDMYVINNMDFCDERLDQDGRGCSPFCIGGFTFTLFVDGARAIRTMDDLWVDGVQVLTTDSGIIGAFIRKTDLAALLVNHKEI